MQTTKARKDVKHFRQLLLEQEISRQFSDVPQRAISLFRYVKAGDWDNGAEASLLLSADLASLNGVDADFIGGLNKKQIEATLDVMSEINRNIPRSTVPIEPEIERQLVDGCNFILLSVHAIERSLSVKAALGGEEDGK
jgi:hypothetical protein